MKKKLLSVLFLTLILSSCSQIKPEVEEIQQDDGFDVELMKNVRDALLNSNPQVVVSYDNDYSYDFQSELCNTQIVDNNSQNAAILEVGRDFTFNITVNQGVSYYLWDHEILYNSMEYASFII